MTTIKIKHPISYIYIYIHNIEYYTCILYQSHGPVVILEYPKDLESKLQDASKRLIFGGVVKPVSGVICAFTQI